MVTELPAGLLLRVLPANWVFGAAVTIFGVCATCIAAVGGFAGLMVLRTFLGVGESTISLGFLYLSMWYKQDELALRSGMTTWQ